MALTVNTNVSSLNAQRNLSKSAAPLQKALQRLSSGLRINSAKDDAAGLAISDRMTAQTRGLNQAARNANDAISLAQTAEGALDETTNLLQRMRELAVQSRNDTNTTADRASLDNEFQQLKDELDRIATTTSFNGRKVLDGSLGTATFQVGANVGETIDVNISANMRSTAVGSYASTSITLQNDYDDATVDDFSLNNAGDWAINGTNVPAATDGTRGRGDGSAYSIAAAINTGTATHGVTATTGTTSLTVTAAQISNFAFTDDLAHDDSLTYTLSINGQQIFQQGEAIPKFSVDSLASQINSQSSTTGVIATVQSNGDMALTAADGRNIEITEVLGSSTEAGDHVVGYFGNNMANGATATNVDVTKTSITLTANRSITLVANGGADDPVGAGTYSATTSGLEASDILTATASDLSINRIDKALSDVDTFRSTLGAIQNRFESTISNVQNIAENISAANSRIKDADFATETAALTKGQILQQAGVAMLAQANQLPQTALSLLQ